MNVFTQPTGASAFVAAQIGRGEVKHLEYA